MLLLLWAVWTSPAALAQDSRASAATGQADDDGGTDIATQQLDGRQLTVGTRVSPPFAMRDGDGQWTGLSIALWESVAEALGVQTRYEERPLRGLFDGLADGSLDVSVAALTVTEPREARIDFSFPFYTTGLAIAVPLSDRGSVWRTVKRFFSWEFLTALAGLTALLLAVGAIIWAVERRRNPEEFGGTPVQGLGAGFWWAAVTMTTVGYGDKSPRTLPGRLVGLVWMFAAIILISGFTAAIATSLTVGSLASGIKGVNDLRNARVMTVAHSAAADALKERGIAFTTREDLGPALNALADGEADAVVYDAPLLKYQVSQGHASDLSVLDSTFDRQDYAFAFAQGSDLREPVNRAILSELSDGTWNRLLLEFIGTP